MRMFGKQKLDKDIPIIKIIDSIMIELSFNLAKAYRYDNKQNRSAVKISTLFNGDFS